MELSDFSYHLPANLVANEPLTERSGSRLMILDRAKSTITDKIFTDLPDYLNLGDALVLNNTKVFPARLFGVTETGASVEIFLVSEISTNVWETMARPGRRLKPGKHIIFDEHLEAEVIEQNKSGRVIVRFDFNGDLYDVLDAIGKTPLPPYIKRSSAEPDRDRERYQTIFAKNRGAIAAPTAGLHFTAEIFNQVKSKGVRVTEITLHVGYGTFEPVRAADLAEHKVLPESFTISQDAANTLNDTRDSGGRIIAVGTTTTRTLETNISRYGKFTAESGSADLTIKPGYKFKAIDALLTNFHLPESSLLILISTFGGHEFIMNAYRHAVAAEYRFYSYGDCMLIV